MAIGILQSAPELLEIIGINLLLSGDNALVIALVMRDLPPVQRRTGMLVGTVGAVLMRMILTLGAWQLLALPGLRLVGGLTLLWMGWRLGTGADSARPGTRAPGRLAEAIGQVIWADAVMSADNVLAVAAAAHGNLTLLLIGIATSIPFVMLGSGLLSRLLDRLPILVPAGGGLLGWVGGQLMEGDPLLDPLPELLQSGLAPACALTLLVLGLRAHRARRSRR